MSTVDNPANGYLHVLKFQNKPIGEPRYMIPTIPPLSFLTLQN